MIKIFQLFLLFSLFSQGAVTIPPAVLRGSNSLKAFKAGAKVRKTAKPG
jgi:hypothetical protein